MSRILDDIWHARSADAHIDNDYAPGKVKITKMDPAALRKMLDEKFAYRKKVKMTMDNIISSKKEQYNNESIV